MGGGTGGIVDAGTDVGFNVDVGSSVGAGALEIGVDVSSSVGGEVGCTVGADVIIGGGVENDCSAPILGFINDDDGGGAGNMFVNETGTKFLF